MPLLEPWMAYGSTRSYDSNETAPTTSVTLTASATPHAVGAWAQLSAGLDEATTLLGVEVVAGPGTSTVATGTLLSIGLGPATEVVGVANLNIGSWQTISTLIPLPLLIPRSTRITARIQSVVASQTVTVRLHPYMLMGGVLPGRSCTTYGANTATSRGANLGGSGTNAWGSWYDIGTTTRPTRWFLPTVGVSNVSTNAEATFVQFGAGAAGSEKLIHAGMRVQINATEQITNFFSIPVRVDLPTGTLIRARAWATASRTYIDACAHCFD